MRMSDMKSQEGDIQSRGQYRQVKNREAYELWTDKRTDRQRWTSERVD